MKIELGMTVKDKITGLNGVAVCRSSYLTGCDRISIQPTELKDGKPLDWVAFDENQLDIINNNVIKMNTIDETPTKVGGPRPNPSPR